jgi:hypothetical protein
MSAKTFKRVNLLKGGVKSELDVPYGFSRDFEAEAQTANEDKKKREIMIQQAWSLATSPASGIFMNLFFFWMMGNSIHIFTLVFLFSIMYNTIKTISNTNQVFKRFEPIKNDLLFYKLIYAAINSAVLFLGLYKLYGLGLLPLHPADYVALVPNMKVG